MKHCFLSLILILFISSAASSQYRLNKTFYSSKNYTYLAGDPYNPSLAGLTSFFVPGLGQMISGEVGRGFAFLGGFSGGLILIVAGVNLSNSYTEDSPGNEGSLVLVTSMVAVGLIDMVVIDICAITDAIRVAKVNNLAFRDKNKTGYKLQVTPYIGSFRSENTPLGLSVKLRF